MLLSLIALGFTQSAAPTPPAPWLVRARLVQVAFQEDNSDVLPVFAGGSVSVNDTITPELDVSYFFTPQFGVEVVGGVFPLTIDGTKALGPLDEVADLKSAAVSVVAQYHLSPIGRARPYVGLGINYSHLHDAAASASLEGVAGPTTISVDDSTGPVFQAGVDMDLSDRWVLNADIKWTQTDTTATLNSSGLINEVDLDVDPISFGLGLGRRF